MLKFFTIFLNTSLFFSASALADSYWLILGGEAEEAGLIKIEMESIEQCEAEGYAQAQEINPYLKQTPKKAWHLRSEWNCVRGK